MDVVDEVDVVDGVFKRDGMDAARQSRNQRVVERETRIDDQESLISFCRANICEALG